MRKESKTDSRRDKVKYIPCQYFNVQITRFIGLYKIDTQNLCPKIIYPL
jgi:hypothetical protein